MGETRSLPLDATLGLFARKKERTALPPCGQSHEGEGLVSRFYNGPYSVQRKMQHQFQNDQSISGSVSVDRSGNCIETSGTSGK